MSSLPAKASKAVRETIIEALGNPGQRFLDRAGSSGNWLAKWGITEATIYEELIAGLQCSDHLFLKKRQPGKPQAYQCILDCPEDGDDYPAIVIHVTLAPRGEPPRVRVAVHPSDTVRTLPALPYPDETDETDENDQAKN
ncbi:hypothetical protein [Haloferula sp. A504]|uniref:hypothetical protein n=1 Tax=Haloferula sp. A504 TaxID=3373601 RepID=UPI0031C60644|nr:hypothetical protein [Verrucomicrobiaceae bacterium E54]